MMDKVPSDLLKKIRELEESLWRAETRFNDDLMDETFSSDFFEYGRSGRRYQREEMFFEGHGSGNIDAVLPLPGFKVRRLADDVVQVTYISEVTYNGQIERGNRSSIWSLIDEKWQLRFHQGTPILETDK